MPTLPTIIFGSNWHDGIGRHTLFVVAVASREEPDGTFHLQDCPLRVRFMGDAEDSTRQLQVITLANGRAEAIFVSDRGEKRVRGLGASPGPWRKPREPGGRSSSRART